MSPTTSSLESIFAAALDCPTPNEQRALIDAACAGDALLKQRLVELLRAHEHAGNFLETPAALRGEWLTSDAAGSSVGLASPDLSFLTPSDAADALGKLASYEVLDVVGVGGMGIVLRARDPKLQRIVAIKVLSPTLAANPTAVARFLREARAAAAVSHMHVVTIHAVDETHRPPFLVMEFVAGRSLQEKLSQQGALELCEILRIGAQTAAGLAAAHRQGLVHRDIKPANILLENGVERVKITDFGLARASGDVEMTKLGQVAGTPLYMSPEQAAGDAIDYRSDLFSLGSVLYAMCTGRPAFRAASPLAVMHRVCYEQPRSLSDVNPAIPDWLRLLIERLQAKDPNERPASAEQVAEQLLAGLAAMQDRRSQPASASILSLNADTSSASRMGAFSWWVSLGILFVAALLVVPLIVVGSIIAHRFPQLPEAWSGRPFRQFPNVASIPVDFEFVDLQPQANIALKEGTRAGNDLVELQVGQQRLGGVQFDIGEKYIQLGGGMLPNAPPYAMQASDIAVGGRCRQLHFLHATQHTIAVDQPADVDGVKIMDGVLLAEYVVHYADGAEVVIPIVHGVDVRDWWNWDRSKPLAQGTVVWTGHNDAIRAELPDRNLRLFLTSWTNPRPDELVETIDFRRATGVLADPFCVAITSEDIRREPENNARIER